jgi:hypothetical protein
MESPAMMHEVSVGLHRRIIRSGHTRAAALNPECLRSSDTALTRFPLDSNQHSRASGDDGTEMAGALVYCIVGVRRAYAYLRARTRGAHHSRNLRYH